MPIAPDANYTLPDANCTLPDANRTRFDRFDAIAPSLTPIAPKKSKKIAKRQLIHPIFLRGPIHSVFRPVFRTGTRRTLRIMMNLNRNHI